MTIEYPSLSVHGYQLLPLATSQLEGNNREFDHLSIFCGVLLIAGRAHLQNIEELSSVTLKIELLFCIRATKVKFFTPWYSIYYLTTNLVVLFVFFLFCVRLVELDELD